jgi:hypothetical protein
MDYANQSLQFATDTTYSTLASMISSLYTTSPWPSYSSSSMFSVAKTWALRDTPEGSEDAAAAAYHENMMSSPRNPSASSESASTAPPPRRRKSAIDLSSILENPYSSVRGRQFNPSSMSAVRSLITLVPFEHDNVYDGPVYDDDHDEHGKGEFRQGTTSMDPRLGTVPEEDFSEQGDHALASALESSSSWTYGRDNNRSTTRPLSRSAAMNQKRAVSSAETASQLAEGTLRALRDMALDEAVELHQALHFWSDRWERPILSWLEAGPTGTYLSYALAKKNVKAS